ncbi:hypothetical protein L6164_022996 [Bauhinia variegata]|uniref:Uncharacterized protein n=1 Tax=Bauhinia variegata TaxID=167791 RepID=A0ACB9MHG5_BAUVA|nr:hypothetical protein L6164_022996 [Bauhinia variegata]
MAGKGTSLNSPEFGFPADFDDEKFVSGLSTILVASIQEAKDKISQIEYIFCSQIYPKFQSNSKTLQKCYSEARKSLEDKWKERENELLLQIEKLRLENQRILEENGSLKVEDEKEKVLLEKELHAKQHKIEELEREIGKKSEEFDEGMELQKNLVQLVQSKTSLILEKERQMKENEENKKSVLARVSKLEGEVEYLQFKLREKNEKLAEEVKFRETLDVDNKELVTRIDNSEKERKRLFAQVEDLEGDYDKMQKRLRDTKDELAKGEELRGELIQQRDLNKKMLDECEKEKKLLLDKVQCLEEKVKRSEACNVIESCQRQPDDNGSILIELQAEKKKRISVTEAYKRLKSQYNFLREKVGLTAENMLHKDKVENEIDLHKHKDLTTARGFKTESTDTSTYASNTNIVRSEIYDLEGLENKIPDTFAAAAGDTKKVKDEKFEDDRGAKPSPPSPSFRCVPKGPINTNSVSRSGTKRPASSWRQTRSHQSRAGPDPHDDFLDTPLENIRADLSKTSNKGVHSDPIQKDVSMDSSDDETQDLNARCSPQNKQSSIPLPSEKSFKYIEPVRKKAEREKLKGVECKQCKKFYDAVLPNGDGKDLDSSKQGFRCEHLDGVSRHRYRLQNWPSEKSALQLCMFRKRVGI